MNDETEESMAPARVTDAPDEIWLVYGELIEDGAHADLSSSGEVLWCEDKQFVSDVRYVRADRFDEVCACLEALLKLPSGMYCDGYNDAVQRARKALDMFPKQR